MRLLLDINEQHTINQIDAHLSNANNNSASNTKQEDERQPMLDLMLAFHLEGLSAAADESYAMTHKFISHATDTFDAVARIMQYALKVMKDASNFNKKNTLAVILNTLEKSIVGKILPLHSSIIASLLCPEEINNSHGHTARTDIDLTNKPWMEELLSSASVSLTLLKQLTALGIENDWFDSTYNLLVFFCSLLAGSLLRISPPSSKQSIQNKYSAETKTVSNVDSSRKADKNIVGKRGNPIAHSYVESMVVSISAIWWWNRCRWYEFFDKFAKELP